MPRRHSGSLVPKDFHDERVLRLMASPLTNKMITFICEKTFESVQCRDPPTPPQTPPTTPGSSRGSSPDGSVKSIDELPSLGTFIKTIMRKSKCHVPTLLCTLVYLERLKERLPSHARGCHTTRHRVFLAALIVAAKYLNDSSPLNKHWMRYAAHFSSPEVNLMERQILTILNFDLRFTEEELVSRLGPLLGPIRVNVDELGQALASTSTAEEYQHSPSPPVVDRQLPPSPSKQPVCVEDDVEVLLNFDSRRDEVIARRRYRPLNYEASPPTQSSSPPSPRGKRLTPAYRIPASQGPLGHVSHTRTHSRAGIAPFPVVTRPPIRPQESYSSIASTDSRGSRPPSWSSGGSTTRSSPRTSDEFPREPSPGLRGSRLSSHSSTSTLSSTSSGPATPSPPLPLPLPYHHSHSTKKPAADVDQQLPFVRQHRRLPSVAPSPCLIHALAHDPDLWPFMTTSASNARSQRIVKGEVRLLDAQQREKAGKLGLNLRSGEKREGLWAVGV